MNQHAIDEIRFEAKAAICESHAGMLYLRCVRRIAQKFHPIELAVAWEFFKSRGLPMRPGLGLDLDLAKQNTRIAKVLRKALKLQR